MRLSAVQLVAFPLLLHCGAKQDLLIGEVAIPEGGTRNGAPSATAGMPGDAATAGSAQGGMGGNAGSWSDEPGGAAGALLGGAGGVDGGCADGDEPPLDALIHRYSFDGSGTTVADSIAGEDGTLVGGARLDGSGVLTLPGNRDGQPDQYVNLPNGLISGLSQVTIVAWTTWQGGSGYQRVFDFGISDQGEVQGGSGRSYLAVMPSTGFANGNGLGAEIVAPSFATQQLPSAEDMEDRPAVVALAYRSALDAELFVDAVSLIRTPTPVALSDIDDKNNWIGQSQWSKDHCYRGTLTEFRLYNRALNACQLQTLLQRGPDAP